MEYPIIESLKKHNEILNDNQFLSLPNDTPFGNLFLSWVEIIQRTDRINDLIIELYTDFDIIKQNRGKINPDVSSLFYKQKFLTEQIFYWLRKTADELIGLIFILDFNQKNKVFPIKIGINSIGHLLHKKDYIPGLYDGFKDYLKIVNEISNGYKHSFINSQAHSYHGENYPVVFALTLDYNNLKNQPNFLSYKFSDILENYNLFLGDIKIFIKENF
jgi:uncharacterized protein Veg